MGAALAGDDVERELGAATQVCKQLRDELDGLDQGPRAGQYPPAGQRNWRQVAHDLKKLESALADLPGRASEVPERHSAPFGASFGA